MEHSYSVTVCGQHAGKVLVQQQGLYYLFSCRCSLSGDVMYRLTVSCGGLRENLGILVPEHGSYVLNKKVPVKRIGNGAMSFALVPKNDDLKRTFVPIHPEEPFGYISRLKESFLMIRNGQPGICIEKQQEC